MTTTEKFLRELIARPSVNPAFVSAKDPRAGEHRVAEFLAQVAKRNGLEIEWQPVIGNRRNLFVRLSPVGKVRRRVLLAPHLDTVNAPAEQLVPRRSGGRLFGRGACDTKGSVTAMMLALCELAKRPQRPVQTEVLFAGLVDEEDAQRGSRALVTSGIKADLAIVGEPTRLRVITAHKGNLWLRLETRGKSAHGARPELGRNAVLAMARIVERLETDYALALNRRRHVLLGKATVNVGAIYGGTQPNIVPDRCTILVDRRTLPGETERSVGREIRALLSQHNLPAICASSKQTPCLPLETDPKLPLVARFMHIVGQRLPAGVDFSCDAAVLGASGIPSVVFGPGDIAQAHTTNEWIALRQVEQAKSMLVQFLLTLP